MPEMTKYSHGVPSWVDMGVPDVPAALRFYGELLGWESQDLGEETGHYTMMTKGGKLVAAISTAQDPGPPRWTTYVNVDDVEMVASAVKDAGGQVVFGPMQVMTAGKMAIFSDTTGAFIAAWQPGDHLGAQLVNEPGALSWNELATSDLAKSKAFYGPVFGWTWGGSDEYTEAQVDGRTIAGVMPRPPAMPAEVPDHWLVYFGVESADASAEQAKKLGATVAVEPTDIPNVGRFAVLLDPQGAAFAIFQM
jgi:predicted enzyme related to lactoylglutathione lyase